MKKTFVIVSVSDRVNELNNLIESIIKFKKFDDYDICILFQDYLKNSHLIKNKDRYTKVIIVNEKMGCNGARIELLKNIKYDIYINLDDDMILTEYTDYNKSIEKALENGTGFVLTNWAKTENLLREKIPKMNDKFIKQIMVYQGGGMVYSEKIAQLIRELPVKKTVFDDIWSITSYINGYTNYRYLGSLAIHMICGKGGMKLFMQENDLDLACLKYINYRAGKKKGKWHIPLDNDINDFAKYLHNKNKKR